MRLRLGFAAAAALLLAGLAAGATPRPTVLGISWEGNGMLARLDARTLVPVGRRIDIGKPPTGLIARSPDGRTIALGHGSIAELRFVDVRAMRAAGRLRLSRLGAVLHGIWPTPRRLVALLAGSDPAVLVVDPRTRRVLQRRPLDGEVMGAIAVQTRLVALLAPERTIGPARLAVAESNGSVRIVLLPGVAAGFTAARNEREPAQQASPGVAVDPGGARAVVVTPETLLVVDLERLEVTHVHHLKTRAPARVEKLIEGWGRGAIWVGGDTVAVSGWTYSVEGERVVQSTTGVELVDITSGDARKLDPTATGATKAGGVLLTFGGSALRGYDFGGGLRFELLRGGDTGYVQTAGRWAYVGRDNSTAFTIVDARAGRVVGTARKANPTIVLGPG